MKQIYIFLFLIVLLVSACEEDVVLDLNDIEKQLVVEANVSNEDTVARVALSYSQGFYDTPEYLYVTDATVIVSDDSGLTEMLTLNEEGVFVSNTLQPKFGATYTLLIDVDDQQIEVEEVLLPIVEIESVVFIKNPFLGDDDSLNVFVDVEDRKGEADYYRLLVNKIGVVESDEYYLLDDSFGEDGIITMPVYYKNFAPGDTVVIELRHLSADIYNYYNSLSENMGGSFNSIAPGNPESNLPDDVLGYFAAYSFDRDTVIVGTTEE